MRSHSGFAHRDDQYFFFFYIVFVAVFMAVFVAVIMVAFMVAFMFMASMMSLMAVAIPKCPMKNPYNKNHQQYEDDT